MNKVKLKRGDKVQIMAGKEVGRSGRILLIDREKRTVLVEGVNFQTKHQKPNRANQSGGITRREAPMHISNVMYEDSNGKPTRIGYKLETVVKDGKNVTEKKRYCKTTGEIIND